jgi:hypothetical protein
MKEELEELVVMVNERTSSNSERTLSRDSANEPK